MASLAALLHMTLRFQHHLQNIFVAPFRSRVDRGTVEEIRCGLRWDPWSSIPGRRRHRARYTNGECQGVALMDCPDRLPWWVAWWVADLCYHTFPTSRNLFALVNSLDIPMKSKNSGGEEFFFLVKHSGIDAQHTRKDYNLKHVQNTKCNLHSHVTRTSVASRNLSRY